MLDSDGYDPRLPSPAPKAAAQPGWWQRLTGRGQAAAAPGAAPALPAPDTAAPAAASVDIPDIASLQTVRMPVAGGEGAEWLVAAPTTFNLSAWQVHAIALRPDNGPLGSGRLLRHVRRLGEATDFAGAVQQLVSWEALRVAQGLEPVPGFDAVALGRAHVRAGLRGAGYVLDAGNRPVRMDRPDTQPVEGTFVEADLQELAHEAAIARTPLDRRAQPRRAEHMAWHAALFDKSGRIVAPRGTGSMGFDSRKVAVEATRSALLTDEPAMPLLQASLAAWQRQGFAPATPDELDRMLSAHLQRNTRHWDEHAVLVLLALGASPDVRVEGQPAVVRAATYRQWGVVQLLLDYGAEPDPQQLRGSSQRPLLSALTERPKDPQNGKRPPDKVPSAGDDTPLTMLLAAGLRVAGAPDKQLERHLPALLERPDLLVQLCERGLDLSAVQVDGRPLLHAVALQHGVAALAAVLAGPTQLDTRDDKGRSALALCVDKGRSEQALRLIAAGALLRDGTTSPAQLLDRAIERGDDATARALVEAAPGLVHGVVADRPMLVGMAQMALLHTARAALALGADTESRGEDGRTALLAAGALGHVATVDLLLQRGADASHRDAEGLGLADLVVQRGDAGLYLYLHDRSSGDAAADARLREDLRSAVTGRFGTPLGWAVASGDTGLAAALLAAGHDPNEPMRTASHGLLPPLSAAVEDGNTAMVELLSGAAGIRLDAIDAHGQTALTRATRRGRLTVMRKLLGAGADVDAADRDGFAPLSHAWRAQAAEAAQLLLAHAADPIVRTVAGDSYRLRLRSVDGEARMVLEAERTALPTPLQPAPSQPAAAPQPAADAATDPARDEGMGHLQDRYATARDRRRQNRPQP